MARTTNYTATAGIWLSFVKLTILVALIIDLDITFAMSVSSKNTPENSDRLTTWKDRWQNDQLGWHETDVHESIRSYGELIVPGLTEETCANPVRVFVPLCGKTVDMAYLASLPAVSGVVGVDGIRKALKEFGKEHPELDVVDSADESTDGYERLVGRKIALLKGDFFNLDESATNGRFEAIFDRASLVAIEPSLREKYVEVMGKLIQPGGNILLVVLTRNSGTEEDNAGPPFSVPEAEVRRLYEGKDWVEALTVLELNGEKQRNKGTTMTTQFYLIQAK